MAAPAGRPPRGLVRVGVTVGGRGSGSARVRLEVRIGVGGRVSCVTARHVVDLAAERRVIWEEERQEGRVRLVRVRDGARVRVRGRGRGRARVRVRVRVGVRVRVRVG